MENKQKQINNYRSANELFILGDKFYGSGDYLNALRYFEEYFKENPKDAFVCNVIGHLHKLTDSDIEEQIKYFKQSLKLNPDFGSASRNLAFAYYRAGKYEKSLEFYKKLLELEPLADDYFAYACLQIQLGNFKEGWKYYEYRFLKNYGRTEYPQIDKPKWEGQELTNKTLLVHYEQGLGDSIHFFRYLKQLEPFVKKIIFKVQDEMVDLLKINANNIEIAGDALPVDSLSFDFHIPLMSLPYALNAGIDTIPFSRGYLKADKNKAESYKNEFFDNNCLKVGISWHGFAMGNKNRNIDLKHFYSLARLSNVKLYSFQKGAGAKQLQETPLDIEIIDLGKTFKDFSDTAAAMENVDLFITSDNSVLNIAGAMGKSTYLLLNKNSEWRWFLDEDKTPWYDSVKIFKKKKDYESWDVLIKKVIDAIKNPAGIFI